MPPRRPARGQTFDRVGTCRVDMHKRAIETFESAVYLEVYCPLIPNPKPDPVPDI